jgi:hypothetical protein
MTKTGYITITNVQETWEQLHLNEFHLFETLKAAKKYNNALNRLDEDLGGDYRFVFKVTIESI